MDYKELVEEISKQLFNYEAILNKSPNNIILGIQLYNILKDGNDLIYIKTMIKNKQIFGLPITIDYENIKTLKVGFMETSNK